jgi:GntR family transcriptional regulator/MocR family aminotransferase
VEAFFHGLAPTLRAPPTLVRAREGHFMDKPDNVISLINLATVRSLEQQWGYPIDPLRFRANIYIDGTPPWSEFNWIGSDIRINDTVFRADRRNGRCSATNVDPATGRRDLDIPGSLRKAFGHKDLGIYLIARVGGELKVGSSVLIPGQPNAREAGPASRPPPPESAAFICKGCYFIYQEAVGHPPSAIAPGTRFADLPPSWMCPDCGTDKGAFRPHAAMA